MPEAGGEDPDQAVTEVVVAVVAAEPAVEEEVEEVEEAGDTVNNNAGRSTVIMWME